MLFVPFGLPVGSHWSAVCSGEQHLRAKYGAAANKREDLCELQPGLQRSAVHSRVR